MKLIACLLMLVLLAACAGGKKSSETAQGPGGGETGIPSELSGTEPPALPDPVSEAPLARRKRVQTLERSIDSWWNNRVRQRFGTQESLETMLRTYTRDHLEEIIGDLQFGSIRHRRIAAVALGFSGSEQAVEPLYGALNDTYPDVVEHALLGLSLLCRPGPKVSGPRVIKTSDVESWETYAADDVEIDLDRIVPFLQNQNPGLRANASLVILHALRNGQTPADETVLALVTAREDANDNTRVHVVAALGHTKSNLAFPNLVRSMLDDRVELVRIRAALGLARLDEEQAVPYLIEVLGKPTEPLSVKEAARDALRIILDEQSIPSLHPEDWRPIAEAKGLL